MNITNKLKSVHRRGILAQKILGYLHNFFPVYIIKNQAIVEENHREKVYKFIKEKYKGVILNQELNNQVLKKRSNKVWICWLQGESHAPNLVKACIKSVRLNMPESEVVIINNNNFKQYTDFPDYILKKRVAGRITDAHFSDLLRVELLTRHGGMWVDATVLCTSSVIPKYITNSELFVYKQLDLDRKSVRPIVASSWFISAKSNNDILLLTKKLLWAYWKDFNHLNDYFLFHICFAIATEKFKKQWEAIPTFNNNSPHELQFELDNEYTELRWKQIKKSAIFHKLNHHINYSSNVYNFYQFILDSGEEKINEKNLS